MPRDGIALLRYQWRMTDPAARFHALHAGPGLLILPNAWDAGSARIIEAAGATAIALSSAAVAWSMGWPDGDVLLVDLHLGVVERVVRRVALPVSVDIEGGYADAPEAVAETVRRFIGAGAVGINIEDGSGAPELLARKIAAIRRAAVAEGVDLFINARTDVWLRALAPGREHDEVVAREALYRDAGASGIFVPGITDLAAITALVAAVSLPLNVLARATLPDAAALQATGVRRLSAGSSIAETLAGATSTLAAAFLAGDISGLFASPLPYGKINALMD
jgi:2-methylisocitrate lyase-like PEP mutase family enzyme